MPTVRETLTYEPVELNFGTSGLRGLVVDMTDLECYINTLGFLKFLEESAGLTAGSTVYLAGDLRDSTPRILASVIAAIEAAGHTVSYLGLIPTPALALRSISRKAPGIMVTGSHIPADRNGIKFYKLAGEVLKDDEPAIKQAVAEVRAEIYDLETSASDFTAEGMLRSAPALPAIDSTAANEFTERFTSVFKSDTFAGKQIIFYQHSAVGRDLLTDLFTSLGAEVVVVGRSDVFIPIDSENVTPKDHAYFRELAAEYSNAFAIVSTDGDSDRPFVIDETGQFHRGDVLGAVVATWLKADFAGITVTTSDAVDRWMQQREIATTRTKVGSPYVVKAMQDAAASGKLRPTGWEVNGGFLTGADFDVNGSTLPALPTRDAALPILVALVAAIESNRPVSAVFAELPQRATGFAQIDKFPAETSKAIIAKFSADPVAAQIELARYFSPEQGFAPIQSIETLDGVRINFANGDIAHIRPSGNAPQLRAYSVANSQQRADEIVQLCVAEPNGIYRKMEQAIASSGQQ